MPITVWKRQLNLFPFADGPFIGAYRDLSYNFLSKSHHSLPPASYKRQIFLTNNQALFSLKTFQLLLQLKILCKALLN